ncbi:MAG: flagellar hook assembly protein FlgD [Verrucomicrobia bacterium]|nr:flagellar hook assembly protein FlgD [Verrucomicrobiota bacterium]MBI3870325.1 flagellar hook assembly protein FlgD [Verrucomicrobiota bacterium]
MADISPITATNSIYAPADANPRVPQKTLDQNDFLKLLVTQFTNQDPMSPLKDTEYIAQMAQFTTLEQSKTMTSSIDKLRADQATLQANALIGRAVELQSSQDGNTKVLGVVSAVEMENGEPRIVVNDQPYALGDVLSIRPAPLQ